MALSEARIKARIRMLVGDVDEAGNPTINGGVVANNIDLVWDTYSNYGNKLRELFCRRDLIQAVLSRLSLTADTSIGRDLGLSVRKSDRAKAYQEMLAEVKLQISAAINSSAVSSSSGTAIGELTTETPVSEDERVVFVADIL